jgi:hypothetical protein
MIVIQQTICNSYCLAFLIIFFLYFCRTCSTGWWSRVHSCSSCFSAKTILKIDSWNLFTILKITIQYRFNHKLFFLKKWLTVNTTHLALSGFIIFETIRVLHLLKNARLNFLLTIGEILEEFITWYKSYFPFQPFKHSCK